MIFVVPCKGINTPFQGRILVKKRFEAQDEGMERTISAGVLASELLALYLHIFVSA